MDVRNIGPTLAESLGNVNLQGPSRGYYSSSDELPGLPAGFPAYLRGKSGWTGAQPSDMMRFIFVLTESDLAELSQGLTQFKGIVVANSTILERATLKETCYREGT